MKKGEVYQAVVEKMEFPNKGIIHVDGEKAVVKNALPGQTIEFLVNKKRKGKCEGRLLQVIEPSVLERKRSAVLILASAEAVCPRAFHMNSSWKSKSSR